MLDELGPLLSILQDHIEEVQRLHGTALQANKEPAREELKKAKKVFKEILKRMGVK